MKTPEEVAEGLLEADHLPNANFDVSRGWVLRYMTSAIEADRAQRRGRLEDLHAYDWIEQEDGEVQSALIVQIDTADDIGRVRVYINDGRIYDGDPETGQEWSLT